MAVTSGQRPPKAPDPVHVLRGHRTDATAVAFAWRENLLLSGDADGEVRLWDLGVRRPVSSVRAHSTGAGVIGLAASSGQTSSSFLSQGRDGVVKVWAITESAIGRQPLLTIETGSYNFCKLSVAEAPLRQSPVAGHQPGSPAQPPGAEQSGRDSGYDPGGSGSGPATDINPGRDRDCDDSSGSSATEADVRPAGVDVTTKTDSGGGRPEEELGDRGGLAAVLRSNESGLTAGLQSDGQGSTAAGARWDEDGGVEPLTDAGSSHGGSALARADSGQQLVAVAGADPSSVEVWDVQSGRVATRLEQPGSEDSAGMCMSVQLAFPTAGVPLAAVVGGYEDGSLMAWDTRAPAAPLIRQRVHSEPVLSLAVDRSGSGGVSGSADDKVAFFSLHYSEGRCVLPKEIPIGRPGTGDIALRTDQRVVATAGWDNRVLIFDYKRRAPLAVLRYHTAAVTAVAFAPRGPLLASASRDAAIAIWSLYPQKNSDGAE